MDHGAAEEIAGAKEKVVQVEVVEQKD